MRTIVVGVDGSESAIAALRFALDEARVRSARVKIVTAWHVPPSPYETEWALPREAEALNEIAVADLNNSLDRAHISESGIETTTKIVEGEPAEVLCEAARGADLLVVGSHGLGLAALLGRLGSVSQHCGQRAPCPVVIVPAEATVAFPRRESDGLRACTAMMRRAGGAAGLGPRCEPASGPQSLAHRERARETGLGVRVDLRVAVRR